jgi:hypothetical protein
MPSLDTKGNTAACARDAGQAERSGNFQLFRLPAGRELILVLRVDDFRAAWKSWMQIPWIRNGRPSWLRSLSLWNPWSRANASLMFHEVFYLE